MDESISDSDIAILSSSMDSSSSEDIEELFREAKIPKSPKRRDFFDRNNPMEIYDEEQFMIRFRFSKKIVMDITEILKPKLCYHDQRNNPIPVHIQVLIALRYYAVGSFQIVSGDLFGVHQVTCGRIVKRVSTALGMLAKNLIKFPRTEEEMNKVKQNFFQKYGFPNILGVVDGTHIPIKSPGKNNAEQFRNRKGWFSVNAQVVCNADLKFSDINARYFSRFYLWSCEYYCFLLLFKDGQDQLMIRQFLIFQNYLLKWKLENMKMDTYLVMLDTGVEDIYLHQYRIHEQKMKKDIILVLYEQDRL